MQGRTIVDIAREYACEKHDATNHMYDDQLYSIGHLKPVYGVALKYIHLIPEPDRLHVLAAAWVHDIIEDARETYGDVAKVCGYIVADIAFALTNNKGKVRKDRADANYYEGIRNVAYADYLKLCDRIANVSVSTKTGHAMGGKYKKEFKDFKDEIFNYNYKPMWDNLEVKIFGEKKIYKK